MKLEVQMNGDMTELGQEEIYSFLKKHKSKWFDSKEIGKALGTSRSSTTNCLMRLRRTGFINSKKTDISSKHNKYLYKFKDNTEKSWNE